MGRKESLPDDAPAPRLCQLMKWPHFQGYGFNLHSEKGKEGQFVGKIDAQSPAESCGVAEGDRIIEVNGVNISNENHKQVVERVKSDPNTVSLLLLSPEAVEFYKSRGIVVSSAMSNVLRLRTPEAGVDQETGESDSSSQKQLSIEETLTMAAQNCGQEESQKEEEEVGGDAASESPKDVLEKDEEEAAETEDQQSVQIVVTQAEEIVKSTLEAAEHSLSDPEQNQEIAESPEEKLQTSPEKAEVAEDEADAAEGELDEATEEAKAVAAVDEVVQREEAIDDLADEPLPPPPETPEPAEQRWETEEEAPPPPPQVEEGVPLPQAEEGVPSPQVEEEVSPPQVEEEVVPAQAEEEIPSPPIEEETLQPRVEEEPEEAPVEVLEVSEPKKLERRISDSPDRIVEPLSQQYEKERVLPSPAPSADSTESAKSLEPAAPDNKSDKFGLKLNMTAAEMKEYLKSKKRPDPRKNNLTFKQRHEIVSNM